MPLRVYVRISSFTVALIFVFQVSCFGQEIPRSTKELFIHAGKRALTDTINNRTRVDFPFINGRYHTPIVDTINHPYYDANQWQKGTLTYNGKSYGVDSLKYNIETDHLILMCYFPRRVECISLDENFIPEFSFSNKTFRYYRNLQNKKGRKLRNGYYEVVYDGKMKFLVRWEKSLSTKEGYSYLIYSTSEELYLLKENHVVDVNSMSGLLGQLDRADKQVMKKYVRDNLLKLSRSNYASASSVLSFYENQKKQ